MIAPGSHQQENKAVEKGLGILFLWLGSATCIGGTVRSSQDQELTPRGAELL